jgi:hypothetical protein
LLSEKSVKILANKLAKDFSNAIIHVSQVYSLGSDSSFEMTEEQFVALLYTVGIFKDIGR